MAAIDDTGYNGLIQESTQTLIGLLPKAIEFLDRNGSTLQYNKQDLKMILKLTKLSLNSSSKNQYDDIPVAFKAEVLFWYFSHRFPFLKELQTEAEVAYSGLLTILAVFRLKGPIFDTMNDQIGRMMNIFKSKLAKKKQLAAELKIRFPNRHIQQLAGRLLSDDKAFIEATAETLRDFGSPEQSKVNRSDLLATQMMTVIICLLNHVQLTPKEWQAIKLNEYSKSFIGQFKKFNRMLTAFYLLRHKTPLAAEFKMVAFDVRDHIVHLIQNCPVTETQSMQMEFKKEEQYRIALIPGYDEIAKKGPC